MEHLCKFIILSLIVLLSPIYCYSQEIFRLNTALKPPLSDSFNLIFKEAFNRLDLQVVVQELPGQRALKNANQGIDDGDAARIFELSKKYTNLIRVEEKIIDVHIVAFSKNNQIPIDGWDSLKPYNVAIVKGYRILEDNIVGTKSMVKVQDISDLFTLLQKDRTDIAVINLVEGVTELKKQNLGKSISALQPPLDSRPLYPHLHKKHSALVPKLARVLKEMKEDGTYQRLLAESLSRNFIPPTEKE